MLDDMKTLIKEILEIGDMIAESKMTDEMKETLFAYIMATVWDDSETEEESEQTAE